MTTIQWDLVADACAGVALAGYRVEDCYWIDGAPEEPEFCRPCGEKKVAEYQAFGHDDVSIGGGYRTEHDGLRFCETCGVALDGSLTDHGVKEELQHFEEYGFDVTSADDCRSLETMLLSYGWRGHRLSARLRRLAFKAIRQSVERARAAPTTDGDGKGGA